MYLSFTTVRDTSLCGLAVLLLMTSSVVSAGLIHRRDASLFRDPSKAARGNNFSGNGKSSLGASLEQISISHSLQTAESGDNFAFQAASGEGESLNNLIMRDNQQAFQSDTGKAAVQLEGGSGLDQSGILSGNDALNVQERSASSSHATSASVPSRAVCPFKYVVNSDKNRNPFELMVAEATDTKTQCLNPDSDGKLLSTQGSCQLVYYNIPVQRIENGRWLNDTEEIPVSRVCVTRKVV